ncbi:MAG: rRNA pseudouridine synthase [Candidatus Aminicenantes bacterium]|nr:MAG: rRNA pseudouridine synthase [Candidatus Aminicenantes bacterium]
MQIRLNKFLAQAGVASRREVDKMIAEGRIKVNGQVVQVLGYKIDDEKDRVDVEGRRVEKEEELVYLMINKPPGYLVTLKDNFQRPTIQQLLPSLRKRVFPVGRLDYDSSGLLLLTNDGELAYRLTHPRFKVPKVYLVKVKGEPDPSELTRLEKGIYLDDKKTAPAKIAQIGGDPKKSLLKVEIYEGRKREVKRMFQAIGHKVLQLQRINFGGLRLGSLKMGKWRFLTRKEIDSLKKQVAPK